MSKNTHGPVEIKTVALKEGTPCDYDLFVDVTSLPNPHNIPSLTDRSGQDSDVQKYVFKDKRARAIVARIVRRAVFKRYEKNRYVIIIGCYGGKHRSVAVAERTKQQLNKLKVNCWVNHTQRWKWFEKEDRKPRESIKA